MTDESRVSAIDSKLSTFSNILTLPATLTIQHQQQVHKWLQSQAILLLDRKQKQQKKQSRLRALQQQFEQRRIKKERKISQKIDVATHNKSRTLLNVQSKLSRQAKRSNQLTTRVQDSRLHQLKQRYHSRKSFQYDEESMSKQSRMSASYLKVPLRKIDQPLSKTIDSPEQVEEKLSKIQGKIERAQKTSKQQQSHILAKLNRHNNSLIQAQGKMNSALQNLKIRFSNKIASKISTAFLNKSMQDRAIFQRQSLKQKYYKQKVDRYSDNLRMMRNNQAQRQDQLNQKYKSIMERRFVKEWHSDKNDKYQCKFMLNSLRLQDQQVDKADHIMNRHQSISLKNKVYKQRKDQLVKAIKFSPNKSK